tara:strand:- start:545 stop:724 length:180 start_codon:yes stop_codon:yes gene_type:complete
MCCAAHAAIHGVEGDPSIGHVKKEAVHRLALLGKPPNKSLDKRVWKSIKKILRNDLLIR